MIDVLPLTDSSALIGDGPALRARWEEDGVLFLRGVMDPELIGWAREKYREALVAEKLIDPALEEPLWTGEAPQTRRPCDAIGTTVWHEVVRQPLLNSIMRDIFDADPRWIPIVGHRSSLPTGPLKDDEDIFAGRHQDGYFNEGIEFTTCWMPIRDTDMNSGSFAVAPGTSRRGNLHEEVNHKLPTGVIADTDWRAADYRVGDVLIFHYFTAHATLPNPSNQIRMSLDVRAVPAWAPQPVVGTVDAVEGTDVLIRTEDGEAVTVHITDDTYIRDMNPRPRVPTQELQRIAYPGAHVMAMAGKDGRATVLRRNFY
ncbi:MAG: phytanoyl-CoA dioxygenase family protein [Sphingobium sp.]